MRVGIITGEFPPMQGGVGDYTRLLALHLQKANIEVSLLTDARAKATDGLDIYPIVSHWDGRSWLQARRWAAACRLDIISLQYQTAAYGMSPWVHFLPDMLRQNPIVTTFHDLRFPYLFPKAGFLRPWIVRYLARRSSGVVVTNDDDALQLPAITQLVRIPIGSNVALRDVVPRDVQAEPLSCKTADQFLVGYFGLMNHSKGVHILLEAIAMLRRSGVQAHLLIVGGTAGASDPANANYVQQIETMISRQGLVDSVTFAGYLEDQAAARALSLCDAVALPYLDGASLRRGSLIAALALGCAIATTTPQSPSTTFRNEENLVLVPPNDAEALASALQRLYREPAFRDALKRSAHVTAEQFSWETIARNHIEFFQRILEICQ